MALQEVGGLCGQNPGHAIQEGLIQILLHSNGSFHSNEGFILLILGQLLHLLEDGIPSRGDGHPPEPHPHGRNRSLERERYV